MRDLDIRRALRSDVARQHSPADTLIVDELSLCLGAVRVDVAVVNGILHGYEIKSDADTLNRLPIQCATYSRVFDRATVVCGASHLAAVRGIVPRWWGLIIAEPVHGGVRLRRARQERQNPSVDAFAQAQLLWRDEALAALEERRIADGFRSRPRRALWQRLAQQVPNEVGDIVRSAIKARQNWRVPSPPV